MKIRGKNEKTQFEVGDRVIYTSPDGRKYIRRVLVPQSMISRRILIEGHNQNPIKGDYVFEYQLYPFEPDYERWHTHFLSEMADQLENKHDK